MTALIPQFRPPQKDVQLSLVLPPLEQGEHLDQKTFHERYSAMPKHVRAELILGVVHMPSPLKVPHSDGHLDAGRWLLEFEDMTPGVHLADNATVILGAEDEPQPDLCLRIRPEFGGQTREVDGYIAGAPELIVEIASSTASIDLFEKKLAYARAGAREYLAFSVREPRAYWFVNRNGVFEPLVPKRGIYRSEVLPGLWLDPAALIRRDRKKLLSVLHRGMATKDHKAFVKKLKSQGKF